MLATIIEFFAAVLIISAGALSLTSNNALFRWPRLLMLKINQHRRHRRRRSLGQKRAEVFEIEEQESEWRSGQN